jgi:hypothetical protein
VPSNFVLAQAGRIWKNMGERKEDRGGWTLILDEFGDLI